MATNLKLDEGVLAEAFKLSGLKTKREAVMQALQEYIQRRQQLGVLKLRGTIDYDPDYDYKAERQRS